MTKYEHDHIFNISAISRRFGKPSQDFLDRHWKNLVEQKASDVHPETFKKVLDEQWKEKGPKLSKDLIL